MSWLSTFGIYFSLIAVGAFFGILMYRFFIQKAKERVSAGASEQLREEKEIYELAFTSITDGIIITDPKGNAVSMNPAAERMTGISQQKAAGQPLESFFSLKSVDDDMPVNIPLSRAFVTHSPVEVRGDVCLISYDRKKSCHVTLSASSICNHAGALLGGIVIFQDRTEEYQKSILLSNSLNNWEIASDLAHAVMYRYNCKTMEMTGAKRLTEFWPVRNGKAVPIEKVVFSEDVASCLREYEAIVSGRITQTTIHYRRKKKDGIHHYRLHMRQTHNFPDSITGLIVDVTDYENEHRKSAASLALWHTISEVISSIIIVKDADDDYRYLYANENLGKLFHCSAASLIGRSEKDFVSPADAQRIHDSDMDVMNSGERKECYEILRDADGIDHHFHSIKIPSVNEFGHRIMIQTAVDISAVEELAEVHKIVSNAFEKLFFTVDNLEEKISEILRTVCEFVGYSRGIVCCVDHDEGVVKLFTYYLPDGEKRMFDHWVYQIEDASNLRWYQKILASRRGEICEYDFSIDADCEKAKETIPQIEALKSEFDVRGAHIQYLDVNGKPWGYVGFMTQNAAPKCLSENEKSLMRMVANIIELSITRHRTIGRLQKSMEEAMAAAEAKSNFVATISHEIRTPLNAVLGFTDLLKDTKLDEAVRNEYLENISVAGNLLLALISDILDLSKLSARKMEFTFTKTSILEVVSQIGLVFHSKCTAKKITLLGAVPPDFPKVWVDSLRIRQILLNLVGNAVKFTKSGTITIKAEFIKDQANTGTLRIHVIDTGIGISDEDIKTLCSPFTQAKGICGTHKAGEGTGLGLAICKEMLNCMNGELTIRSALGKGSTFTITMRNVQFEPVAEQTSIVQPAPAVPAPSADFSGMSVLIVDDVKLNLIILQELLKKMGISATTAGNAEEALARMAERKFDCVLTDLWMPGMNGVELAAKILQNAKDIPPKIAIITADSESRQHYDLAMFDAILTKPLSKAALEKFLSQVKA